MIQTDTFGRTTRRLTTFAITLLVTASGTATAHGGGSYTSGMMGGGGWSPFGGLMGFWGLLWMALLFAIPVLLVYAFATRGSKKSESRSRSVLRDRYARGEISDNEYKRRQKQLE
ncbi:SHOCT domain-containing protein [Halomicrococcus sp. NG-SE-24]|uniref:SHOCT domain-containing protein n=1 Tax=Halomicrococcus sp. NG-SE-24 TaxID=3436928 RepID=UPI003D979853